MRHAGKTRLLLLAMAGTLATAPAAAAPDCKDPQDQATMNECAGQDFSAAGAQLNAVYKQLAAKLKGQPDQLKLLVTAEQSWINLRNADCDFQASGVAGGSAYPMIVMMCRTGMTNQRIDTLKSWLDCQEGDLSCPTA
jgi:uncharacterized protein YecT (DUF1311 family)